jgi:hypothetical protein
MAKRFWISDSQKRCAGISFKIIAGFLRIFALQNRLGEARRYRKKLQWEGNLDELRTAKWRNNFCLFDKKQKNKIITISYLKKP